MDPFHVFTFPAVSLSFVPESVINAAFYTFLSTDLNCFELGHEAVKLNAGSRASLGQKQTGFAMFLL